MKQFQYQEFISALQKLLDGKENRLLCRYSTKHKIERILDTDYPYQEDDIEYLLDMVNYQMRLTNYDSNKKYYKLGKVLDGIILDSELYLDSIIPEVEEARIG